MSKIQQTHPPANVTPLALAAALCLAGTSAFAQTSTPLGTVNVTSSSEAPVKTDNASSAKFTAPLVDTPKTVQVINEEIIKQTGATDRKSTRLNSSHLVISYAVFCLKKKKKFRTSG